MRRVTVLDHSSVTMHCWMTGGPAWPLPRRRRRVPWRVTFDAVTPHMQQFLDVGLRHHRREAAIAAPPGSLAALMGQAYRALLAIADDDGDAQRRRLDDLRGIFTACAGVMVRR